MSTLRTALLGLIAASALMAVNALAAPAPKAVKDPAPPAMIDDKSVAAWVGQNLKGEGWVLVNYDAEGVRLATPEGVALMSDGLVETDIRHELFTPITLQTGVARSGLAHWAVDCDKRQFAVLSSVAYAHNNLSGPIVNSRQGDRRLFQAPVASENDTLDAVCQAIRTGKRLEGKPLKGGKVS
ncbi:surface-adhesin E family protein [Phenylobacterium sp.]|uniref:surface-adhesin E family protein n=1 Tax=Phenylobacterium sp. TaxID=1871053 RepID=UPI0012078C2E|nr:surface-adhesin E family protein [Phenylobacterium sp.]THD64690.1 MAG: hypothetical protein E8A49_01175 [Phenylobacterium sp.]